MTNVEGLKQFVLLFCGVRKKIHELTILNDIKFTQHKDITKDSIMDYK